MGNVEMRNILYIPEWKGRAASKLPLPHLHEVPIVNMQPFCPPVYIQVYLTICMPCAFGLQSV